MSPARFQKISNNRLERDMYRTAYSFNLPFIMLLASKYQFKYDRIYPNGKKYLLFNFVYMLFMNGLCIYQCYSVEMNSDRINFLGKIAIEISINFYIVTYFIGFTMMFITDFVFKNKYVLFILKIQSIYVEIGSRSIITSFITWNWIYLLLTIAINILLHGLFYSNYNERAFDVSIYIIRDFHLIVLDINVVLAIRIIVLLRKFIESWIQYISVKNDEADNALYCRELFGIYVKILNAYSLYEKLFQLMKPIIAILKVLLLVKDLGLIIVHSEQCEKFYMAVTKSESVCIQLIKNGHFTKYQKRLYKNVIRRNRVFSKMSACGLFDIDATLPIRFTEALTHYVIVLLQFNYL
ncbi:hypothetical protein B5X24_HaOG201010 [Helicoverpa armigera]|nr:hypothetical protein B5X24_HaOG201010 [Helicoverpa armigera]